MSITFYADGWVEHQEKRYMVDMFPGLSEKDFENDPFLEKDDKGHFVIQPKPEWECNFSNSNAFFVFEALGQEPEYAGFWKLDRLKAIKKCAKLQLSSERMSHLHDRLKALLVVIETAMAHKADVHWS